MNDILKAALQTKYGMSRKEVIDRCTGYSVNADI